MKTRMAIAAISIMAFSAITMFAQGPAVATYKAKCAMCHGTDGKGNTPAGKAMKAHDFASPQVIKMSDAELEAAISAGKGKMPAYGKQMSSADIHGLTKYIRTLQKK